MKLQTIAAAIKDQALELVFPSKCLGCGKGGAFLCPDCRDSLPRLLPPFCDGCAEPTKHTRFCARCVRTPLAIDGVRAPFLMQGTIRDMVHALKYKDLRALAPTLAGLLADYLSANPLQWDLLMAVPIHKRRERQRGYNQAALLTKELSKLVQTTFATGLVRTKDSPPQAKSQSMEERRANVQDAYQYRGEPLEGKRILLVDDVCTTGSTLDACASVLKASGAAQVWGLTLAREA